MDSTAGTANAVLAVVRRMFIDPAFPAEGLQQLVPLLADEEGARAFVNGPPGRPEHGGLCWVASELEQLNRQFASGLMEFAGPAFLMVTILAEFLATVAESSALSPFQLASAPWVGGPALGSVGILGPLVALLEHMVQGHLSFDSVTPPVLQLGMPHNHLLQLLRLLAKDQRVGKRLVIECGVLTPLFAPVAVVCRERLGLEEGEMPDQSIEVAERSAKLMVGCMSADVLMVLHQQEDSVKAAYLDGHIVGATMALTRLATEAMEVGGGLMASPQAEMLFDASWKMLDAASSVLEGSAAAQAAFRAASDAPGVVVAAMGLPAGLGRSPDAEPAMVALAAALLALSMAKDPVQAKSLEEAGVVPATLAFLSAPPFAAPVLGSHLVASRWAESPQYDGGRLLLVALAVLDVLLCNQKPFTKLDGAGEARARAAVTAAAPALRTFARAQRQARVVDQLRRLGKVINVDLLDAASGDVPSELRHSLAATVTVTNDHAALFSNPGGLAELLTAQESKSKEQLRAEVHTAAGRGELDTARAASKELLALTAVERAHQRGTIDWRDAREEPEEQQRRREMLESGVALPHNVFRGMFAGGDVLIVTHEEEEEDGERYTSFSATAAVHEHGVSVLTLPQDIGLNLLEGAERALEATARKADGTRLFTAGQWRLAADMYSQALDNACNTEGLGREVLGFHMGRMAATCLANRAQCWLNVGDAAEALADATAALKIGEREKGPDGGWCIPPILRKKLIFRAALAEDRLGRRQTAVERLRAADVDGLVTPEGQRLLQEWAR